jgi:hypothetical protein
VGICPGILAVWRQRPGFYGGTRAFFCYLLKYLKQLKLLMGNNKRLEMGASAGCPPGFSADAI